MLLEPITLRGLEVRNRAWLSPMCMYSSMDGMPDDFHVVHYGARAQGGFGLIIAEATAVVPEGRITSADAGLWNDAQRDAWRRVVDVCHASGAAFGVQLAHAGRKASTFPPPSRSGEARRGSVPAEEGGWQTLAPSDVAYPGFAEPAAMTVAQVREVIAAFAAAARRAVEAGMDFVEVHAAHGYLLHEFCSPLSNRRDDEYGGSFEGRTRLLLEVVDAVRAELPETMPLLLRISATDWVEDGWGAEDAVRLAPLVAARGVDVVDTSTGGNVPADVPAGPGYQVEFAAAVRKAGVATAAVGLITDPAQAEEILTSGRADAVCLGRVGLREPAWPLRAAHELGIPVADAPYSHPHLRGAWPA